MFPLFVSIGGFSNFPKTIPQAQNKFCASPLYTRGPWCGAAIDFFDTLEQGTERCLVLVSFSVGGA